MKLNELQKNIGAKQARRRLGRGPGSGLGKTSGKGEKGQNARSGGGVRPVFEGGQLPLYRRIPKRGFLNINSKEIIGINLTSLEVFEEGATVDIAALIAAGIVKNPKDGVKILGRGDVTKKLTVQAKACSESAKEKIEAAGGKAEVI